MYKSINLPTQAGSKQDHEMSLVQLLLHKVFKKNIYIYQLVNFIDVYT